MRVGGEIMTKTQHAPNTHTSQTHGHTPPVPASAPLTAVESSLLNTLRSMGAVKAAEGQPSDRIERRAGLKHGPMMHALQELERKGYVARIAGRKDVVFYAK